MHRASRSAQRSYPAVHTHELLLVSYSRDGATSLEGSLGDTHRRARRPPAATPPASRPPRPAPPRRGRAASRRARGRVGVRVRVVVAQVVGHPRPGPRAHLRGRLVVVGSTVDRRHRREHKRTPAVDLDELGHAVEHDGDDGLVEVRADGQIPDRRVARGGPGRQRRRRPGLREPWAWAPRAWAPAAQRAGPARGRRRGEGRWSQEAPPCVFREHRPCGSKRNCVTL